MASTQFDKTRDQVVEFLTKKNDFKTYQRNTTLQTKHIKALINVQAFGACQDYEKMRDAVEDAIMTLYYDDQTHSICNCCSDTHYNTHIVGQCRDGCCDHGVDIMCDGCGTWDEEEGVWRCEACQDAHEEEEEEDDVHKCAVCHEKQDKGYSTCCEECGLLTCEDCLEAYSGACCPCGDEKEKDNDYCSICNVLTNTKNCVTSKSCCVCQEITFCDDCVKEYKGDDCSHSWETHHICVKCEEVEKKINLTQGA